MMIMSKVFGRSIEESGFVRACCLYYSTVSAGLLSKTPLGRTASLLLYRVLRERNGGIGSCILTFDPRVLFTGVLIQRMEAHFGSYHPPGNSTEVSWFSLCCWFEYLLEMCREVYRVL